MPPATLISEAKTLSLIEEVKNRPLLWDLDAEHHTNRYYCMKAWKEIAIGVDIKEEIVKAKWKNLRDMFKRELIKFRVKSLEEYRGRWRHFKLLWFLAKNFECEEIEEESQDDNDENEESLHMKPEYLEYNEHDETEVFIVEDEEQEDPIKEIGSKRSYNKCDNTISIKKNDNTSIITDNERSNNKTDSQDADDEYDAMFLKSLTPYFRQLDSMRKLVVRCKMQDMLMNELAAQKGMSRPFNNV